jgi:hypothetical protein
MDDRLRLAAWREYAAWGSLFCGLIALLGSLAAGIHSDHLSDRLKDPWFGWYLLLTGPVSILGLTLGIIGKDSRRVAGVVLSAMLLVLIASVASV